MSYAGMGQVVVSPTPSSARVAPALSISDATLAKAEIDRLFRAYRATSYLDAFKRNNLRRELLSEGRKLVRLLNVVRPASEAERIRLRALAASALASSQLRQRCFMTGATGCGRIGVNEPDGPSKTNDEFVAITRPLDAFVRTRNTVQIPARPAARAVVAVAGRPMATVVPSLARNIATAAKGATTVAAAKLATDVKVAQAATNAQTKVAADKVVIAQTGADAAAKAAEDQAAKAKAASEAAVQATQIAQSTGSAVDAQVAQVASQVAEATTAVAEQATAAAAEIATVADVVRSELEVAEAVTNDVAAQEATTEATMTVAVATAGLGPLGISWKAWGLGAAVLVGGYLVMNSKMMSPNRRRRVRRNRRRR